MATPISILQKYKEKMDTMSSNSLLKEIIETSAPEDLEALSRKVRKMKKELKKNKKTLFSVRLKNEEDGSPVGEMKFVLEDPEDVKDIEEAVRKLRQMKKKAEDYDIEKVLKSLEIEENPTKKRKPKSTCLSC